MTTINDLMLEENMDVTKTPTEILDDIKNWLVDALLDAKKCLADATLITTLISLSQNCVQNSIIIDDTLPSIEIAIPTTATELSIKVIEESVSQIRLKEELKQLSLLQNNWDNEAAKKPTRLALRNASLLLSGLDESILSSCTFFPSNDAGIYFQGRLAKGKLTIFLNDEQMAYIVKGELGKLTASVKINRSSIQYLNSGLKEYV